MFLKNIYVATSLILFKISFYVHFLNYLLEREKTNTTKHKIFYIMNNKSITDYFYIVFFSIM